MATKKPRIVRNREQPQEWKKHRCYECSLCEPYMAFHTLTLHGRRPTMGTCPHEAFKVLLSQQACMYFQSKPITMDNNGENYQELRP